MEWREHHLRGAEVRDAIHANPPVAPRLLPEPPECVAAVGAVVLHAAEGAFGGVAAARVLDRYGKSPADSALRLIVRANASLAVRRARQQHRKRAGTLR